MGDARFAYRRFGNPTATPVVFTQHLMGNLDNFDPAISDALAAGREVILFDNAGVAASTGTAPSNLAGMAADAARFIDELGLATVDIVGHSLRNVFVENRCWLPKFCLSNRSFFGKTCPSTT